MDYLTPIQNHSPSAADPHEPFDPFSIEGIAATEAVMRAGGVKLDSADGPQKPKKKRRPHPFTLARPTANHPNGMYTEPRAPLDWVALTCSCDGKGANASQAILTRARIVGKPTVIVREELLADFALKLKSFYAIVAKFEKLGLVRVLRPRDPGSTKRQRSNHITVLGLFVGRERSGKLTYSVDGQSLAVRPDAAGNEGWYLGDKEFTAQPVSGTKYERYFIGGEEYFPPYHEALIKKGLYDVQTEDSEDAQKESEE